MGREERRVYFYDRKENVSYYNIVTTLPSSERSRYRQWDGKGARLTLVNSEAWTSRG
jgi:hypothetical protein